MDTFYMKQALTKYCKHVTLLAEQSRAEQSRAEQSRAEHRL